MFKSIFVHDTHRIQLLIHLILSLKVLTSVFLLKLIVFSNAPSSPSKLPIVLGVLLVILRLKVSS